MMNIEARIAIDSLSSLIAWNVKTLRQAITEFAAPVCQEDVERLRKIEDELTELVYEVLLATQLDHNAQRL